MVTVKDDQSKKGDNSKKEPEKKKPKLTPLVTNALNIIKHPPRNTKPI